MDDVREQHGGEPPPRISLNRFLRYFLGLGVWGFGGPIATVGYMQRDLVEKRQWMTKQDFLDGIALGQTMPGPLAAQVAMWVGFLRAGPLGAAAIAAAFILPSFLVVLILAFFYVHYQGLSWMQALFYGIAPAVMAIIAIAAVKLARLTNGTDKRLWALSIVILLVTAITGAEVALHVSGDWGQVGAQDARENALSLDRGFRLLSSYRLPSSDRIWIITEADRSLTTLLLPSDY